MSEPNPYGQPFQNPPPGGYYPPQGPPPSQLPPSQLPPRPPAPPQPLSPSDERMWGMLAFLLAIVVGFLAPLVIYFVFRDRSAFVRAASRESLNLQITATIVSFGAFILFFITGIIFGIAVPPVGIMMIIIWWLAMLCYSIAILIFDVIGAMKANSGIVYEVPFILRLVKN